MEKTNGGVRRIALVDVLATVSYWGATVGGPQLTYRNNGMWLYDLLSRSIVRTVK